MSAVDSTNAKLDSSSEFLRDCIGRIKHAQKVLARDLAQISVTPATPRELLEQIRKLRDILQTSHGHVDAIKIAAEADVVDASDVAYVLDVVGDIRDRHRQSAAADEWLKITGAMA